LWSFARKVTHVLFDLGLFTGRIYSQWLVLLKQLRAQGMPLEQLHTVFQAIPRRLAYAWGPFLSADLKHKIDGFLERYYRYG